MRTYCRLTGHAAPEVFHTNEGHAGFLGLERIAELCDEGLEFGSRPRSGAGRHRLHHPHPGSRPASTASTASWSPAHFGPDSELPRIDVERVL
ncbi:glycogen phosphorylase OS=Streptomyces tendae OX=1932 GN=GUR47_36240 PE=3 SV=1 [Streptomyces tendae]